MENSIAHFCSYAMQRFQCSANFKAKVHLIDVFSKPWKWPEIKEDEQQNNGIQPIPTIVSNWISHILYNNLFVWRISSVRVLYVHFSTLRFSIQTVEIVAFYRFNVGSIPADS